MNIFKRSSWLGAILLLALVSGLRAGHAEERFALVVGNAAYKTGTLATPANDAGLVAETLAAVGFAVTGAANLDQAALRETFQQFIDQVAAAGPDTVALIYLTGDGLQFNGDNYFVPVDADIRRDVDVPLQALRISDFMQPLAALPAKVKIVILDAARQNSFARAGNPLAGGLALLDPVPGMAIAYNAAPGTVGPNEPGPYGAYATALTEMIAAGGLSLDDIFARVRLRVSNLTQGAEIPWYVSGINTPFFMTEREAGAPPLNVTPFGDIRHKPLRDFTNVDDAYAAVLELDTLGGYQQFLALYPNSPYAQRVAAMLAVRREEIIWRRSVTADTPPAYWSYLRRYPHGPHAWDARRRLAILRAAFEPPPNFAFIDFGVPPPPPAELVFIDRPVLVFAGPGWAPPPPPPPMFLQPRPHAFAVLPPPPPPSGRFALPLPPPKVIPVFVRPPAGVRPPNTGAPGGGGPGMRGGPVPISLPKAVAPGGAHGAPAGGPQLHQPPVGGVPNVSPPGHRGPPPPASAVITPTPPPPHPPAQHPAAVKPAPLPPHELPPPHPAVVKPVPLPPQQPPIHQPAIVRPAVPPPHAPIQHPAVVKPASPPPPHPPSPPPHPATSGPPHPAAKPECPAGKHLTPQGCK